MSYARKLHPAAAATGTWTEEEIRHQPRAWIRSLTNIDALRSALNNFLEPLLRKENLQIILTGAGTSAFIGDIIAPWLASHTGKNFSAVPTTDLVTNPMDYLNPAHPLLLISFGRSGNSPESVAAVELANQFVPECYHLPITCNEAGALYQNAINSDNAFALLMPAETHDRGFAMTSSITTMMASCLAVFAPETINSQTFRDVADRCRDPDLTGRFQRRCVWLRTVETDRLSRQRWLTGRSTRVGAESAGTDSG